MTDKETERKRHRDKYKKNKDKHLAQKKEYEKTYYERRAILTIMRRFNLDQDTAKQFYIDSMKSCNSCNEQWDPEKHTRRFSIDHCHTTGRVRGILCHGCNASLGLLEESTTKMKMLIAYTENVCNK